MFPSRREPRNTQPSKRRFLPVVERLEGRDVPSTLTAGGPYINGTTLLTNPAEFTEVAGSVYYSATDASRGSELVRQTGSSITVFDILPGASGSGPSQLTNAGGNLYFLANTGTGLGNQLFTQIGNTPTLVPGSPSNITSVAALGRDVFMITSGGTGLYRTLTNTTAGTLSVVEVTSDQITPSGTLALDHLTGLIAGNSTLWLTQTTGGIASLFNFAMGPDDQTTAQFSVKNTGLANATSLSDLTFAGPQVYFNATINGAKKLQVYNGTSILSLLGSGVTSVGPIRQVNSRIYFAATRAGDTELWSSNGTTAGTALFRDLNLKGSGLNPTTGLLNSAVSGNSLFFSVDNGINGVEPGMISFSLNGTGSTLKVFDLGSGSVGSTPASLIPRNSNPQNFVVANQRVFFSASIPFGTTSFRTDLWTSDGTDPGTFMVNPPSGVATTSTPSNITAMGNSVYYGGNNGKGQQPFQLTMQNTYSSGQVRATLVPVQGSLTALNNMAYFISGTNLYQSNGTSSGTTQVSTGLSGVQLAAYNGYLYFFKGNALWRTNGISAVVAGSPTPISAALFQGVHNNQLWFSNGKTLYSYNSALTGSSAFSAVSASFLSTAPGISNSGPALAELNGTVFFAATDGVYSLNPITSNVSLVASALAPHSLQTTANGISFLDGDNSLVLSNGTTASPYTPPTGSSLMSATALNGSQIAFTQKNETTGINSIQLTSGLANPTGVTGFTANTSTVGLEISGLYTSNSQGLYLTLTDPGKGSEPWLISPSGQAQLVADLNPLASTGSSPQDYVRGAGSVIYFSADNGTQGREVYRYDPNLKNSKTNLPLPPTMTTEVNPTGSSSPDSLTASGSSLFWRAQATVGNSTLFAEIAEPLIPPILSINRLQPLTEVVSTAAGTTQVVFQVSFNYSVDSSSVTKEDFVISKASTLRVGTIDSVQLVAGTNQYNVTVSLAGTTAGFGEIRVDESSTAIFTNAGLPVDKFGGFTAGQTYTVNPQNPVVTSLNRFDPLTAAPVNDNTLTYKVTFSTGIDPATLNPDDFSLILGAGSSLNGTVVTSVTPLPESYTQFYVNVAVASGQGTLRTDVKNGASILSLENQPYQQPGFIGQTYSIDLEQPYLNAVTRLSPTDASTNEVQVTFQAVFTEPMVSSSINSANTFLAIVTQDDGTQSYASIQSTAPVDSKTYNVRVAGLPLTGTLELAVNPSNTATDLAGNKAIPNPNLVPPTPNQTYTLTRQGPLVTSEVVLSPSPVNPDTASVTFQVNFNKLLDHNSISTADFSIGVASGAVSGLVASTTVDDDLSDPNSPFSYVVVVVNQLSGNGSFTLNLPANASITDVDGNQFSGPYTGTVPYTIADAVRPAFESFSQIQPSGAVVGPDGNAVIQLQFSEGIQGLTMAYLPTSTTGSLKYIGASVSAANLNGSLWNITYTGLTGSGSLKVELINSPNIVDAAGNPLAGTPGQVVGSFETALTSKALTPITFSISTPGSTPIVDIRKTEVIAGQPVISTTYLQPFDSAFTGGVRCTTGDYNGDGVIDIIATAAQGGSGHVVVYSGVNFSTLASFYSFPGYQGAVNISAGNLDGGARAEIVVGVAGTGASHVKAFGMDVYNPILSFIAYPGYYGGITVAAGDVTGDGLAEVITGTMGGTTPHVIVFSGQIPGQAIYSFYAYDSLYLGAVNVAAADLTGDNKAEIITGSGPGAPSTVVVFKIDSLGQVLMLRSFFPFGGTYLGGVDVGSGDWDNNGQLDLLAGAQSGVMPTVAVYDGNSFALIDQLFAFDGQLAGGVSVG